MMSVARRIVEINEGCHHNDWLKKEALDIYGKRIGVIGLGAIGRGVVKRAKGFDMEVYGYDIVKDEDFLQTYDVHFSDIDTMIRKMCIRDRYWRYPVLGNHQSHLFLPCGNHGFEW